MLTRFGVDGGTTELLMCLEGPADGTGVSRDESEVEAIGTLEGPGDAATGTEGCRGLEPRVEGCLEGCTEETMGGGTVGCSTGGRGFGCPVFGCSDATPSGVSAPCASFKAFFSALAAFFRAFLSPYLLAPP